ncbi:hypothetical protein [Staphylococcus phage vB_SauM-V1SA20]|nr:hypothetical protein [Staphylococcus phage vB_SauM-V1SA20]
MCLYTVMCIEKSLNSWEPLTDNAEGNHEPSLVITRKVQRLFRKEVHSSEWK